MHLDPWTAFLAGLIFAVHPLASQGVAFITGRSALLAGVLGIAAVGAMLSGHYILACGLVGAACFAKEDAASYLGVIAAAGWIFRIPGWWWPLFALAGGAIYKWPVIRDLMKRNGNTGMTDAGFAAQLTTPQYQITAFTETMRRFPLWVCGLGLNLDHAIVPRSWSSVLFWFCLADAGLVLYMASHSPVALFVFAWIGIPLLPYLLIPMPDPIMEQRLYFSVAGIAVGLAYLLSFAPWFVALGVVGVFAFLTWCRASAWKSEENIWGASIRDGGRQDRARINLAADYLRRGLFDKAKPIYEELVQTAPQLGLPHSNLAYIYEKEGRRDLAIAQYRECVKRNPRMFQAWYNLAIALESEDLFEAEENYRTVLTLRPKWLPAINRLGMVYALQGDWIQAEAYCRQAHDWDPLMLDYLYNLAIILQAQGKHAEGIACLKRLPRNFNLTPEMLMRVQAPAPPVNAPC